MTTDSHPGELALRRYRIDELPADARQPVAAHVAGCSHCRVALEELDAEHRHFEAAVPFERFVGGVERAAKPVRVSRGAWQQGLAAAAGLAVVLVSGSLLLGPNHDVLGGRAVSWNRLKGGASVELVVQGADGGLQREASSSDPEELAPGEHVRIGFDPGGHHFVSALSIDEEGVVTPLYPATGASVYMPTRRGIQYLPESLEFTGDGLERVVVFLMDDAVEMDALTRAASDAFERAHGNLSEMKTLSAPGDQFSYILLKP